MKNAMKAV